MKCPSCGTRVRQPNFKVARPVLEAHLAAGPVVADTVAEELGVASRTVRLWLGLIGAKPAWRPTRKKGRSPLVWTKGAP